MIFASSSLRTLAATLLRRAGAAEKEASVIADILVWCDAAGRPTQGLWRLEVLCDRIAGGGITSPCNIDFQRKGAATMLVDGGNGSGHYVCHQATLAAIAAARESGLVALAIRNSNHCGALGHYAWIAAEAGLISFIWSNAYAKVAAFGGNKPVLGTNPMAFGAPRLNAPPIIVDLATSASAGSSVRLAAEEGRSLKDGIAKDYSGNPLRDASLLDRSGYLLPFGGAKGYALALVCEILCGALASDACSRDVRSMYGDHSEAGRNGQFMMLLNPACFVTDSEYSARTERIVKGLVTDDASTRIPGYARSESLTASKMHGVPLAEQTIGALSELCTRFDVRMPNPVSAP